MSIVNYDKFSWAEAFSSPSGKTSTSLVCAFIIVVTGCVGFGTSGVIFLIMTVFIKTKDTEIINGLSTLIFQAVAVITIGTSLLGIRRFTADKKLLTQDTENIITDDKKI